MTALDLDAHVDLDTPDFDLDGARMATTLAPFATVDDYERIKGVTVTPAEEPQIEAVLDIACQEIRTETDQDINFVQADEIVLFGNGRTILILPQLPVTAINSVTDTTTTETITDALFTPAGILYRQCGWPRRHLITVNYDHGYDPVPADLINIAVQHAFGIVTQRPPGIQSENIDGYSYTLESGANPTLEGYARILDRYRAPEIPAA